MVGPLADGVAGQILSASPWLAPRHDAGLEGLDDPVGDDAVGVLALGLQISGVVPPRLS